VIDPAIGPAFVTSLAGLVTSVALLITARAGLKRVESRTARVETIVNGKSKDRDRELAHTRESLDLARTRIARQDFIIAQLAERIRETEQ
jgi:hypothetical protein